MNLNKQMDLATAIFGSEPSTGVERVSATATADSADGSVTVQFEDGSTLDVPVTGAVKSGDEVIVNVQQGTPIAAGAAGWGDRVQTIATDAATAAAEAQAVAEATGQHFWDDSNGAHVTEVEQGKWTDPTSPNYHTGRDILLNSNGILLRDDYANLASFTPSAVSFYDGSGDVTASFGTSGATIGRNANGESRTEVSGSGMQVIYKSGGRDRVMANIGYGLGQGESGTTQEAPYYTFGRRDETAIGNYSVSEGYLTYASNYAAHAEGLSTLATGIASHTEGYISQASGEYSHAEGANTEATGNQSHAQNYRTIAASEDQTAMGHFNIADNADTYALIVGNGAAGARSNAFTVAWSGDIEAAGEVIDGHGNKLSDAGGSYKFVRYIPTSAAAQSMGTSVQAVNAVSVVDAGDSSLVTNPATGEYEFQEAGTYRISAQVGMYPNTTAKTRLCVGLYDTSISGTRLALGVQAVYNMTANNAAQVVTVACEYVGEFAAGDRIAFGAFADVTAAKVTKGGSGDLTRITFETMHAPQSASGVNF